MTLRISALLALGMFASSCFTIDPNCSASTCTGCCGADGRCNVGTAQNACGSGGNACDTCVLGQSCQLGRCSGGSGAGGGTGGGTGGGFGGGVTGGGTTGTNTITGLVTYEFVRSFYDPVADTGTLLFAQSTFKPVRNAVVIIAQNNASIGNGVTGEDGRYSIGYTPSGTSPITLIVLSRTVSPAIQVEDNTDNDLTWAIGGTITTAMTTFDVRATAGWTGSDFDPNTRTAAPFAILDSMLTASRAFMAVRNVPFPPLKVNWSPNNVPQAGNKAQGQIGTSHFSPQENEIYVLGKSLVDTDEFDSHVIVHEWGHFFEANLARSDSPGGRHGPGDVLDPRIAFGEAWGNAVASMVLPETVYADSNWGGGTLHSFGFDTETEPNPTDDPSPSGFSESSVLRVLYDLYDTTNAGEPFDQVGTGLGPIYDVLTGHQKQTFAMTTLASFVTGLRAAPGVNGAAMDTLLARYNVGPVTTDFGNGDNGLNGMYTDATMLPYSGPIQLGGGNPPNSWQQNQYYVFNGTGGNMTLAANSSEDVAITAYLQGRIVGQADANTSGTETISLNTQAGQVYILVLTGFGATAGDYNVNISISGN